MGQESPRKLESVFTRVENNRKRKSLSPRHPHTEATTISHSGKSQGLWPCYKQDSKEIRCGVKWQGTCEIQDEEYKIRPDRRILFGFGKKSKE